MAESTITIASCDLTSLVPGTDSFEPALQSFAEALVPIEPDALCIRGAPSTTVLRAITGFLVRQRNKLMRMSCTAETPGAADSRYLGLIYRQTNAVATRYEEAGEHIGLSVNVVEPRFLLAVARQPLDGLPEAKAVVVCAPPGAPVNGDGHNLLSPSEGTDTVSGRGISSLDSGAATADEASELCISWHRLEIS